MKKRQTIILLYSLLLSFALPLHAQEAVTAVAEGAGDLALEPTGPVDEPPQPDPLAEKMAAMEQALASQQDQINTLEKEREATASELSELKETVEVLEATGGGGEEAEDLKRLDIYGFLDLTFAKSFYEKDSPFNLYFPKSSSFFMSGVNLYVSSQLTQTLSALVETRLMFAPHGWEEAFPVTAVLPDGTEILSTDDPAYIRTDTTVRGHYLDYSRWGGIVIERAHLQYSPLDGLNVIAGRFLTPYGIWNIDHGTPVILGIRVPYLQTRESVPLAQTGLQVYGRFFPADWLHLDYAVTFSNGRGPIDTIVDLDENKGLGARLQGTIEKGKFSVAAGGYFYWGTYTDLEKHAYVYLADDGTLDEDADNPLQVVLTNTEKYEEFAVTGDLKLKLAGVLLQGELTWRRVNYDKAAPLEGMDVLFAGAGATESLYTASFTGLNFYGLLGYQLPLEKFLGPVTITPYFLYENVKENDTLIRTEAQVFAGGLNVKPSPVLALKVEYNLVLTGSDLFGDRGQQIAAQMAVAF